MPNQLYQFPTHMQNIDAKDATNVITFTLQTDMSTFKHKFYRVCKHFVVKLRLTSNQPQNTIQKKLKSSLKFSHKNYSSGCDIPTNRRKMND